MSRITHITKPDAAQEDGTQAPALGVMFLAGCPLFLWVFQGSLPGFIAAVVLLGLLASALNLIRKGQKIQACYDAAEVAYRPKFPYKIFGSVLIGLLVMILAASQFASLWMPLGFGILATGLALAAFGVDPLRDKGTDNPDVVLRQRAAELICATERTLDRIVNQIDTLDDADLTRRTGAVRDAVIRLLRALSNDPSELRALRKPLMKFLQMLLFEADHLCEDWKSGQQPVARKRFVAKLSGLAIAFEKRARKQRYHAERDAFDLEADLLLDRMTHETAA